MKNCKITISGGDSEIYALGEMQLNAKSFKIFYELDGDKCAAEYKNGVFSQTRSGSFNMSVQFAENQNSECVISDGGLSGAIDVFTDKLNVAFTDGGVAVTLKYKLGGEEKNLTLSAVKFQEKK